MTALAPSPAAAKVKTSAEKPERIPLNDLRVQYDAIRDEARAAFDQIAESGAYAQGPATIAFEKAYAQWCNVTHCVGVNTGTSALHIAMHSLDIGPGDEVITVPATFVGTIWPVFYLGAKPVFVDIDPARRTMDPEQLVRAITPRTKAIVPVHLYGQMADMKPILEIAARHGIPVIEDACQAHGATYNGHRAGSMGSMAAFSFYPGKNLGALGESGALVTSDNALAARCRNLRNHAQSERYHHDEVGYNYRMDSLQAAMLSLKLKHMDRWNVARAFRASRYDELLQDLPITLPKRFEDSQSVWHCYVIESDHRDAIRDALTAANIETGLHYPVPLHLQKACKHLGYSEGDFQYSEALAKRCLTLPMYHALTDEQLQRVASVVRGVFE